MPRVVVAPDKFRDTATAGEAAAAMAGAAESLEWEVTRLPLSDGGEGLLEACAAICPQEVETVVTGPDGSAVAARWRLGDRMAVVESALASGLALAGGSEANDPMAATSRGTGELLVAAASRVGPGGTVIVGLGGSATTDGGLGALEAVGSAGGLADVRLVGACDVAVPFMDAARLFAPQKGADHGQVTALTARLGRLAGRYVAEYGVDVSDLPGAGAAGGLGGALAVLGGELRSGYSLVCDLVGLPAALDTADRVVTGEGALDATSFVGKVVGGVVGDARARGIATLVVAGRCSVEGATRALRAGCDVVSLSDQFGPDRAMTVTGTLLATVVADWLGPSGHPP
jgi:glycerate kinase